MSKLLIKSLRIGTFLERNNKGEFIGRKKVCIPLLEIYQIIYDNFKDKEFVSSQLTSRLYLFYNHRFDYNERINFDTHVVLKKLSEKYGILNVRKEEIMKDHKNRIRNRRYYSINEKFINEFENTKKSTEKVENE